MTEYSEEALRLLQRNGLTPEQNDALDAANAPDAGNPFATIADIPGGSSELLVADAYLDDARIKTLRASEFEIVDNVPAGFAIYVVRVAAILDQTNGAYDFGESPDYAELDVGFSNYWTVVGGAYGGWFSVPPANDLEVRMIESAAAAALGIDDLFNIGAPGIYDLSPIDGVAFCVGNLGTEEIAGGGAGNSLTLRVWYSLVPVVAGPL